MTVGLQTFATVRDASRGSSRANRPLAFSEAALCSCAAINEDAADFSTLVRCTDRTAEQYPRFRVARAHRGRESRWRMILANRELALLHPAARSVGGPAVRAQATVGGNLFAPPPYGDFAAALLALGCEGLGPERIQSRGTCPSTNSCAAATFARRVRSSSAVEFARPRDESLVPLPQGIEGSAEGQCHCSPSRQGWRIRRDGSRE